MKNKINLAACIVFYERLEQTIECINSLLPSGVNIYVLNNGSSLSSLKTLAKTFSTFEQIKIFDSDVNLGPGGGRNYLINHTTEDWLLFLDNDVFIKTRKWLDKINKHISQNKKIEVFIPKMLIAHLNKYHTHYSYRIEGNIAFPDKTVIDDKTNTFPGGASFISRNLFKRLGLYDDKLFIALEEFELSLRGIISGKPVRAKLIYDIEVVHDHRPARGKKDRDAARVRYGLTTIDKSFQCIAEKHGIVLLDSARIGTVYNLEYMLHRYNIFQIYFWKQIVPKPIKRFLQELYISKVRRQCKPKTATLFLTDKCNFSCRGCRRLQIGIDKSKDMSLSTVQRLLSIYPGIRRFCIAGQGEPTLAHDFLEITNYLKKIGKSVSIITNGTNPLRILKLSYDPDSISISLYGSNRQQYISYTGADVFENVVNSFKRLRSRFNNVGISFIVNKANYKELDGILSLCDKIKPAFVDLHNYLAYDPSDKDETSKIITRHDTEIIAYIKSVCRNRGYRINKPIFIDLKKQRHLCRSYSYLINLDGSGNIGGCQRQLMPNQEFGNIFNELDPYNSKNVSDLRKKMFKNQLIHEECAYCFGNWRKEY
jgi:GT2 family glycosyltransferase/MoaA/NifB/PqqE/SkfB family radical SAM enzyme